MNISNVLTNHIISFMERQEDSWAMRDTESRYIYSNKTNFFNSCLPINFNIEGKRAAECPASWSENADVFDKYDEITLKLGKPIFYISIHRTSKKRTLQSFFAKKFPYYNHNKITGTILHSRKMHFLLLSKYFFKNPTTPSFLTNHPPPPNNLFMTEELNVLFFSMKLFGNKEIALRLGISACVVEQIIRQICNKIDIHSRKQLRDYGIAEGFDNYFPPFLLKGLL